MRTTILLILVSLSFSLQAQQIEASINKGSSADVVLSMRSTANYPFESIATPISFIFELTGFNTTPMVSVVNDIIGFAVQVFPYEGKEYLYFTSNNDFDLATVPSGFTPYLSFNLTGKDGNESVRLIDEFPYSSVIISKVIRGGINQLVIVNDLVALPVDLTLFTVEATEHRQTLLKWETASELNNHHFDVEHSLDGITFAVVGQVDGAGTTSETIQYKFIHTDPSDGYNYYRLKQVDYDDTSEYSDIEVVYFASEEQNTELLQVFPNPTVDRLVVTANELDGQAAVLSVIDAQGRQVRRLEILEFFGTRTLDVSALASGKYYVQLQSDTQMRSAPFLIIK